MNYAGGVEMMLGWLILFAAAGVLASAQAKRSPLALLIRAALHWQASVIWIREYAWPALAREREQYGFCFDKARRRAG